jgi:hypothetical protein
MLPPAPRRRAPIVALATAGALAVVVGVAATVVARTDAPSVVPPTTKSPAPPARRPIAPPSGLAAEASTFEVTLTWDAVEDATGYEVLRDGRILATVREPRFVDGTALPGQRYEYGVVAFGGDGLSDPATVGVRTEEASLGLARLEGSFEVRLWERSHYGLTLGEGGRRSTSAWRFEPRCERGPCGVRWIDRATRGLAADLRRSGATYRGAATGRFGGTCGSMRTRATVTLELRVVEATVAGDAWRASRVRGTLSNRSSAQLGCVRAGIVYRFTATLVG